MKIVVTGAGGYIGRHVVQQLLNLGHDVYALDLNYDGIDSRAYLLDVNLFSGNVDIYNEIGRPDVCLHLAWKDGFSHNSNAHMEMLSAHYIFIKNLLEGGLKQIAVMGSMHEIGYFEGAVDESTPTNPLSYYGIAKNSLREATKLLAQQNGATCQWLRAFYILGDDIHNNSIFSKICKMEAEGQKTFPFVSGKNKYDFLDVKELSKQIACAVSQTKIKDEINICSGKPVSLADKVMEFIAEKNFQIQPDFGKFPERAYDSPAIWGDNTKIQAILKEFNK